MDNLEVVTRLTFVFFVYLIMAIFVERAVEVLMAVFKYVEFKKGLFEFWNRRAEKYRKKYERLYAFQGVSDNKIKKTLNWLHWKVIAAVPYPGGKPSVSAPLIRINAIRISARIVAFFISLILVLAMKIDVIVMVKNLLPGPEFLKSILDYGAIKVVITAAAISIGSEPLHELIRRVENISRKKTTTGGA